MRPLALQYMELLKPFRPYLVSVRFFPVPSPAEAISTCTFLPKQWRRWIIT